MSRAARIGLSAGAVTVLAALVGMVEGLRQLAIVAGRLTMTEALLLAIPFSAGVYGARAAAGRGALRALASALLAGILAAVPPAVLVLAAGRWDLQAVFVNANEAMVAGLVWGRGPWATFVASSLAAAAGGGWVLSPPRLRRALLAAAIAVLAIGAMSNLIRPILALYRSVEFVGRAGSALFASEGLTGLGAVAVLASAFLLVLLREPVGRQLGGVAARWAPERRARLAAAGRVGSVTLTIAALLALPFLVGSYPTEIVDKVGLFILMGLGLNIVVGFAGLLDLGYVAFYAIGAYTVGVLTAPSQGIEASFVAALPIAVGAAILSGVILGIPVLKTHGDYLAIITLGFGEIIRILAQSDVLKEWLGGAQGITLIPPAVVLPRFALPVLGRIDPAPTQDVYYPILILCLVAVYVTWRLRYSRLGRAWLAVREDEEVAAGLGINLVSTKLMAFATGAGLAGISGALFATKVGSIFPASFGLLISINVLVLIILGGMGSIPGVFIGALVLVALPELLREFSDYRLLLYGAVLVVMMLTRPQGLWPAASARHEFGRSEDGPT